MHVTRVISGVTFRFWRQKTQWSHRKWQLIPVTFWYFEDEEADIENNLTVVPAISRAKVQSQSQNGNMITPRIYFSSGLPFVNDVRANIRFLGCNYIPRRKNLIHQVKFVSVQITFTVIVTSINSPLDSIVQKSSQTFSKIPTFS